MKSYQDTNLPERVIARDVNVKLALEKLNGLLEGYGLEAKIVFVQTVIDPTQVPFMTEEEAKRELARTG